MAVTRYLSGAWAAVHGPAEPGALLRWTLERGFQGLVAGPGPRARDWRAFAPPLAKLPVRIAAVRAGAVGEVERRPERGLASAHPGERQAAMAVIGDAVAIGAELGCRHVILEPGSVAVPGERGPADLGDARLGWTPDGARAQRSRRNAGLEAALDAVCRSLFALQRRHPQAVFCLTGTRDAFGLGEPQALGLILDDRRDVRYWHDAAVAARHEELFGTPQGEWLHPLSKSLSGMTLGDSAEGRMDLPPGAGRVDWPLLASYRLPSARGFPVVIELDPAVPSAEIPGVHAFLGKIGL
jgi:sugar phosphate isomerase/epimerase